MTTLEDLQRIIGSGQGNVIVINNLTINVNDYSQHAEVYAAGAPPDLKRLYPWNDDAAGQRYAARCTRDRWENDHESTGYL